jgi:NADPH:quinone reductase-like Zn-dependent oxidoreductase
MRPHAIAAAVVVGAVLAKALVHHLITPSFPVHARGIVLVTGASSGIGLDAALTLAQHGYTAFAGKSFPVPRATAVKLILSVLGRSAIGCRCEPYIRTVC